MSLRQFQEKKSRIIKQLSVPAAEYTDASPKGSVDEPIRELVDFINGIPNLVTTSSCSGRVSIYVEGKGTLSRSPLDASQSQPPANTGKGGGKWAFVTHEPITAAQLATTSTRSLFGLQQVLPQDSAACDAQCPLVHFKFEPMILHILAASLADAQRILSAAMQSGFRESGATSLSAAPTVAVRSNGLTFDSIIGYQDEQGGLRSVVSDEYLSTLVALSNQRFALNGQRIQRFGEALAKAFADADGTGQDDRAARREENRRQGKLRQTEKQAVAHAEATRDSIWADPTPCVEVFDDHHTLEDMRD